MSRVTTARRHLPREVDWLLDRYTIGDCLRLTVYGQLADAVIVGLAPDRVTIETTPAPRKEPRVAPGWLLTAIAEARGTHDCPVCNAGRPIPDTVTCPLCAGWTTI